MRTQDEDCETRAREAAHVAEEDGKLVGVHRRARDDQLQVAPPRHHLLQNAEEDVRVELRGASNGDASTRVEEWVSARRTTATSCTRGTATGLELLP